MNTYSYGTSGLDTLVYAGAAGMVLGFIAFIAAIVVTVLLYKKYVSTGQPAKVPGMKRDWGPFFRFEELWIENILKALFIFIACLIAFESAVVALCSLFMLVIDFGAALSGIIGAVILCVVLEVINRIGFEFSMITILIWKNTNEIRRTVQGGISLAGGPSVPEPDAAPAAEPVVSEPAPAAQPEDSSWECPNCGHENKSGSFCAQCGNRR